jgi:hypothetical protein
VSIPVRTCENANCRQSEDPVNLHFLATWQTVTAALDNDDWDQAGWMHGNLPAVDQYLCDGANPPGRKQDAQRVKDIDWRSRYHVRVWSYGARSAESVGSAHAETISLPVGHKVMTYESGEQEVAISLATQGWSVERDIDHKEALRSGKFDSGRITKITP